ncbi:MAG: hypothetical protein ACRYG8_50700 [Janthinobacterium lividum]
MFNNSSGQLAGSSFGAFDDPVAQGSIDFWRVTSDPLDPEQVFLVETRHSIPLPRGAMQLNIAELR